MARRPHSGKMQESEAKQSLLCSVWMVNVWNREDSNLHPTSVVVAALPIELRFRVAADPVAVGSATGSSGGSR